MSHDTPFHGLATPPTPAVPDETFRRRLRADIVAALAPDVDLHERSATMTDTASDTGTLNTGDTPAADRTAARRALVPYLAVHDAAAAIDWYRDVFGAVERTRYVGTDGRIGHCELSIDGSTFYLADEYPDHQAVSPRRLGGTPVKLHLQVDDVDLVFDRAVEHGATARREPADQPYGERSASFADPFGHEWMVQTPIGTPSDTEIESAMGGAFRIVSPDELRD